MKKNTLISLISIAFIVVLFLSCDEIGLPYTKEKKVGPVQTGDTLQKVLIEDYTGAQCGFCPRAAEIAHTIAEANPGRVIIISVHSGNFAKPSGKYTYDFRTAAGDEFDKFFGNSKAGNPNGLVNRTEFSGKRILLKDQWQAKTDEVLLMKPPLTLTLNCSYSASTKEISASVKINYIEDGLKSHYLCLFIVEDSIVKMQTDFQKNPADVPDYVHNAVLRDAINGTWGEALSAADMPAGFKFEKTYTYKIQSKNSDPSAEYYWRPEKLKIIAFVHDYGESYKILQAEEKALVK